MTQSSIKVFKILVENHSKCLSKDLCKNAVLIADWLELLDISEDWTEIPLLHTRFNMVFRHLSEMKKVSPFNIDEISELYLLSIVKDL